MIPALDLNYRHRNTTLLTGIYVTENPVIECRLFASEDLSEPVAVQEKEMHNGRPQAFVFEDLTPNTWYRAVFPTVISSKTASFKVSFIGRMIKI